MMHTPLHFPQDQDFQKLLELQANLEGAFATSGLRDVCKSRLKYVKMHDTVHHLPSILLYEDPSSYSTEVGELLNRLDVKRIYAGGNHHEDYAYVRLEPFFFSSIFSPPSFFLFLLNLSPFLWCLFLKIFRKEQEAASAKYLRMLSQPAQETTWKV